MGDDSLPRGDRELARWLRGFVAAAGTAERAQRQGIGFEQVAGLHES